MAGTTTARPWYRRTSRWLRRNLPRPRLRVHLGAWRARHRTQRQVLLVGEDALMWQYLDDFRALFAGDPRLRFTASPVDKGQAGAACRRLAGERGLPFLTRNESKRRWWDLAVFANHGAAHRYAPRVPTLRIQHALAAGKKFHGRPTRYDPRLVLRRRGRPLYDVLFEGSAERAARAEQALPALRGRIRVVGDLRADALLALAGERERVRTELGYRPAERVVVLCSTWGDGSLIQGMGRALIEHAGAVAKRRRDRFLLSVHPRAWRDEELVAWMQAHHSPHVRLLGPGEDWERAFVAADVLLVDHTSLLAMYALLGKPYVCVPIADSVLDAASTLAKLRALAPTLAQPHELEAALDAVRQDFPREALRALAHEIDAAPGEAAERMRAATYELLRLLPENAALSAAASGRSAAR